MFDASLYEHLLGTSPRPTINGPSVGQREDEPTHNTTQPSRKRPAGLGLGLPSSDPRKRPTGLGHGVPSTSRPVESQSPPSPSPESCVGMLSSSTSISSGLSLAATNHPPHRKRPTGLGLGIPPLKFKYIHAQETDKSSMLSTSDSVSSGIATATGNATPPFAARKRAFSSRAPHLQISKFAKRRLFTIPEDGPIPDFGSSAFLACLVVVDSMCAAESGTMRVVKKMVSSQIIGSLSHKSLF